MSSWTSDALWKHSTATAILRTAASWAGVEPGTSAAWTAAARNGRQRLPPTPSHSRATRSACPSAGPSKSSRTAGSNQVLTVLWRPPRSRRREVSAASRWMESHAQSSTMVSTPSSWRRGTAPAGIASGSEDRTAAPVAAAAESIVVRSAVDMPGPRGNCVFARGLPGIPGSPRICRSRGGGQTGDPITRRGMTPPEPCLGPSHRAALRTRSRPGPGGDGGGRLNRRDGRRRHRRPAPAPARPAGGRTGEGRCRPPARWHGRPVAAARRDGRRRARAAV